MNIIFNDSNNSIGGIEVMFIEMAKYLSTKSNNVYFIVDNSSVYEDELNHLNNIYFIKKKYVGNIELMSKRKINREREYVLSQLDLDQDYFVISPYFQKLQYAMAIFKPMKNFKLIHLWAHPQQWAKQIKLIPTNSFSNKIKRTKKYKYQKRLLMLLEEKRAHYYSARAITVFNNWYYNISLNPTTIETLPIQSTSESPKVYSKHEFNNKKTIRILWCGRLTYFKNEAIIEIANVLNKLAELYPKYNIEYGIIGFGSEQDEKYIKENINSDKIKIDFLGKVRPNNLLNIFKEYDIGVAMGLTVKKMGQVGLPAIVIDSFEKERKHNKNSNWLFETAEGDAGDGYYYEVANKVIENRKELFDLLNEVFETPSLLNKYSIKCINYVAKHYSFEKQIQAVIDTCKNSTFYADDYPVYRRNFALRILYSFYKNIKSR